MAIFKINFFKEKCLKVSITLYFNKKKSLTLEAQKSASKLWIGSRPPPTPPLHLRKNSITNPLFLFDGFPNSPIMHNRRVRKNPKPPPKKVKPESGFAARVQTETQMT